jgi:hypothetical protein
MSTSNFIGGIFPAFETLYVFYASYHELLSLGSTYGPVQGLLTAAAKFMIMLKIIEYLSMLRKCICHAFWNDAISWLEFIAYHGCL